MKNDINIIKLTNGVISSLVIEYAHIDFTPQTKYKIHKQSPYDPTIIIKKGKYFEDLIECVIFTDIEKYNIFVTFISNFDNLYVNFLHNDKKIQREVEIVSFPKAENELREFPGEIKISFKSIYKELSAIDFDNIFGYGNNYGNHYGY